MCNNHSKSAVLIRSAALGQGELQAASFEADLVRKRVSSSDEGSEYDVPVSTSRSSISGASDEPAEATVRPFSLQKSP